MPDIITELKAKMASACFNEKVQSNLETIESGIRISAMLNRLSSDELTVILALVIGRMLCHECPNDEAREHYANIVKSIMDKALKYAKE